MRLSRRTLLRTGTAGVLIIGAAGGWLSTRTSAVARAPWEAAARGFGDPRLDALAYAILAPNPHNMQPWLIRLDDERSFTLFARSDRLLPHTDPPARQITIGFGCFLELFRQASAEKGYRVIVERFPEGEPQPSLDHRPVARVQMMADATVPRDPLFASLLSRHTQRAAFDVRRPVPEQVLTDILAYATPGVRVAASAETEQRERLRSLTSEAWMTEWSQADTREESIAVTRIGPGEVEARPWGICLDGPLLGSLGAVGVLSREGMRKPGEVAFQETEASYLLACNTAMAHIWSATHGNTRVDQLNAGATWVRLHQASTLAGLAFHPLSQALQEFPAMAGHYRQIHSLLAQPGETVQMLARVGYAPGAKPAPREPLLSKLETA
jgi:hypothetical protein